MTEKKPYVYIDEMILQQGVVLMGGDGRTHSVIGDIAPVSASYIQDNLQHEMSHSTDIVIVSDEDEDSECNVR